jgi:hypothetical protein
MVRVAIAPDTLHLQTRFREVFGCKPPKKASREFLIGSLNHYAQSQQYGRLPPDIHKKLIELPTGSADHHILAAGIHLVRQWQGDVYEVRVLGPRQFLYQKETYRSLSAIARAITGTVWNGHTFFGLLKDKTKS